MTRPEQPGEDTELLDELRAFAGREGRPPKSPDANDPATELPCVMTFYNHFGTWSEALEAAGFRRRNPQGSDEEPLDVLREYNEEYGNPPTQADMDSHETLLSSTTYRKHFSGWNTAIKKTGLTPSCPRRSDEQLLDHLRAFADEHGRPPTATEIDEDDTLPSDTTFQRRFGSWNKAIEAAGLTPRNSRQHSEDSQHANP